MTDLTPLADSAIDLFRRHSPWLVEKLAAAAVSQTVKEAWDWIKKKLTSPGGQEAVHNVESQPEKDRNWDTLKNHLLDALEQDAVFRERLSSLMAPQTLRQSIKGDRNKQAAIIASPGASIK